MCSKCLPLGFKGPGPRQRRLSSRKPELVEGLLLDLTDPLGADPKIGADLLQRPRRPAKPIVAGGTAAISDRNVLASA